MNLIMHCILFFLIIHDSILQEKVGGGGTGVTKKGQNLLLNTNSDSKRIAGRGNKTKAAVKKEAVGVGPNNTDIKVSSCLVIVSFET